MRPSLTITTLALCIAGCITACGPDDDLGKPSVPTSDDAQSLEPARRMPGRHPSVVLVHGAWADALGWQKVIALLESRSFRVTAVENTLTSLADDVATTKRAIEAESAQGSVIVVGHSFGGAAITGAAAGLANVKALVYIDAFAPDVGEPVGALAAMNPSPLGAALVADASGFLTIDRARFRDVFCGDVPPGEARILAATQKPVIASAFGETLAAAAWKTIPSWYLVGTRDHAIPPATQRFMATRMGAHVVEVDASHASLVSRPDAVARIVEAAARATAGWQTGDDESP